MWNGKIEIETEKEENRTIGPKYRDSISPGSYVNAFPIRLLYRSHEL